MARGEAKSTETPGVVKRGVIEYLLLLALLLVVIVTAWTLWDNGIADTVAALLDSSRR
jgi:hypothetical protein